MYLRGHYHLVPRSQQAYKLLQMAISMHVDLGLQADAHNEGSTGSDTHSRALGLNAANDDSFIEPEEGCRASLGCYYLSSM